MQGLHIFSGLRFSVASIVGFAMDVTRCPILHPLHLPAFARRNIAIPAGTSFSPINAVEAADVKTFAAQMIKDHTKAETDLKAALGKGDASAPAAPELAPKHAAMLKQLEAAEAADFQTWPAAGSVDTEIRCFWNWKV